MDTWTVNTAVQDETTRQDGIMADHHVAMSEGLLGVTCLSTDMISSMCLNVGLAVHSDTKTRERYARRLVQALNATEHPQRIDGFGIRGGKLWLVVPPLLPLGNLYAWQRIRMHVQCGKPNQKCYGQPRSFRVRRRVLPMGKVPSPTPPHTMCSVTPQVLQ
jgi:hypothetical protein